MRGPDSERSPPPGLGNPENLASPTASPSTSLVTPVGFGSREGAKPRDLRCSESQGTDGARQNDGKIPHREATPPLAATLIFKIASKPHGASWIDGRAHAIAYRPPRLFASIERLSHRWRQGRMIGTHQSLKWLPSPSSITVSHVCRIDWFQDPLLRSLYK